MDALQEINNIIYNNKENFKEGDYLSLQNKLKEFFKKVENVDSIIPTPNENPQRRNIQNGWMEGR